MKSASCGKHVLFHFLPKVKGGLFGLAWKVSRQARPSSRLRRRPILLGSHVAPFPPSASIKADSGGSSTLHLLRSQHVRKHLWLTGTCSGCTHPGLGTERNHTTVGRCPRDVRPWSEVAHAALHKDTEEMGACDVLETREETAPTANANLTLPQLPQATGQQAKIAPRLKLPEHSSPR